MQGRYLSRRLGAEERSDGAAPAPRGERSSGDTPQTEHLKDLVHEAYAELEELYSWLRRSGVSKYSLAGARRGKVKFHRFDNETRRRGRRATALPHRAYCRARRTMWRGVRGVSHTAGSA